MKNILITGAAGYIGSVCTYNLLKSGYNIYAFDNLSTGHIETIEKLKKYGDLFFIKGDLKNYSEINSIMQNDIDAVIHFAALSKVEESQKEPVKYYENNVLGSINLIKAMINNNVKNIVFSSSAAVYGNPNKNPISESHPKNPINVYGRTKLVIENILYDCKIKINSISLRYFNACGASSDILFGEMHTPETHLIPNVLNMDNLKIYGNSYNTKDGTCIRDYIDVEDLSDAHIAALKYLETHNESTAINLGSKKGYSIFEILNHCKEITNTDIKYEIYPNRQGDPEILVADNMTAKKILNWEPKVSIKESIEKAYNFKIYNK